MAILTDVQNRWEFYIQLLIFYTSQSIANPTFRLLFAELIPEGEEIMWFGLQVILSCATTWVNYVATGPLQSATHNLRFPLVLCLVFLLVPVVLEGLRGTLGVFKRERARVLQQTVTVNELVLRSTEQKPLMRNNDRESQDSAHAEGK